MRGHRPGLRVRRRRRDGPAFTINVDQHLPGLGIGLVSYDPMTVTITGTYASDVVQVVHAGYDPGTTVTGLSGLTLADFHLPKASPDGGPADVIVGWQSPL